LFKSHVAAIQVHDAATTITPSGNIISGNINAAGQTPATIYLDNSHGEIHYTDSTGALSTEGRVFGRRHRLIKWAIAGGIGFIVLMIVILFFWRRNRRK
jgi:hypothetical protein